MKKILLFTLLPLFAVALFGCDENSSSSSINPDLPTEPPTGGSYPVYFYNSYNEQDTPLSTQWVNPGDYLYEIEHGEAPEPLFANFAGWSLYPFCQTSADLWDFDVDTFIEGMTSMNIYGIWLREGDTLD